VRNTDGGEEEVQGGGGSAAMVATTASISWPAAADFLPLLVLSSSWDWEVASTISTVLELLDNHSR